MAQKEDVVVAQEVGYYKLSVQKVEGEACRGSEQEVASPKGMER